jgi:hypothetical protein
MVKSIRPALLLSSLILFTRLALAGSTTPPAALPANHIVGMYIHEHWPYNHPYAARTWTIEDWRGYAGGLKKLGFNTVMIWPMIEIMPEPLTPSDRASLEKDARVIDMLHHDFGMRVMMALTANVIADNQAASASTFEHRHFFYTDQHVNPADANAVAKMLQVRRERMRYLAQMDAVAIIDSDPGGYPNSTNAEFVNLLVQHRKMFDSLRPGIELDYWVDWGWQAYGRFYQTGVLKGGTEAEFVDTIERLRKANPEPWGLAGGLAYARKLGLASRVISFNYGRIEAEPSFPMTNFGGKAAYEGGSEPGPRGVMGNAQTHCVQLPNTFAFSRGAAGKSLTEADYVHFANDLIPGRGRLIVNGWQSLSSKDPVQMRGVAKELSSANAGSLEAGPLGGLLFGDPHRFLNDLIMQLNTKAAYQDLLLALDRQANVKSALGAFVAAAETWQQQNGFQGNWEWPGMAAALRKLHSPEIDAVFRVNICLLTCPPGAKPTGYKDVKDFLYQDETMTTRLLAAMKDTLKGMQ